MKIGVVGPFTGVRKAYGDLIKECTAEVLDSLGPSEDIKIHFVDDRANGFDGALAADYLIDIGCSAVIGHFNSQSAKAAARKYHGAKVLFIAPAATTVDLPFDGEGYVYRTCPDNLDQIQSIRLFLKIREVSEVRVVKDNTDYSDELLKLAMSEFEKEGINIVLQGLPLHEDSAILFFGTHPFCIEKGQVYARKCDSSILVFCDDCAIDEFAASFSEADTKDRAFVVSLSEESGYKTNYKASLDSLLQYLAIGQKLNFTVRKWRINQL